MNNTAQNNTREAITFTKLRSGAWGLRGPADDLIEGETVTAYKRNGETVERTVEKVVWTDGETSLASVKGARRPSKRGSDESQPATPPQPAASEPEAPASLAQLATLDEADRALQAAHKQLQAALEAVERAQVAVKAATQREVDERHTVRLGPDVEGDLADERAATADRSERRGVTVVMTERTASPPPAVVDTDGETVSTDAEPDGFDVGDLF